MANAQTLGNAGDLIVSKAFTEKQRAFVRHVGEGLDLTVAAINAGYGQHSAREVAYSLMQQPAILLAVQIATARRLAIAAPVALRVLVDIAGDAGADKRLRVVCAKTLLDRAGHIAPRATAPQSGVETPLNEMSTTELRALADKLEGELAGRAAPVSASAAPAKAKTIDDLM